MSEWTIVGAGPSIEALDLASAKVGRVVAVNRAFYRFPALTDVWAASDNSVRLLKAHEDAEALVRVYKPEVWTQRSYARDWRGRFPNLSYIALDILDEHGKSAMTLPWGGDGEWCRGTTLFALGIVLNKAATYVKLLGVDQDGVGGYMNGRPFEDSAWWVERWERERRDLERVIREAAEHGVTVEWVRREAQAA